MHSRCTNNAGPQFFNESVMRQRAYGCSKTILLQDVTDFNPGLVHLHKVHHETHTHDFYFVWSFDYIVRHMAMIYIR